MTSVRAENEVEIERPRAEVFTFVSDQEHLPAWSAGVARASRTSPGPVDVGTTYRIVGKMLGRRVESTYEVTAYEPDRLFAGRVVSPVFAVEETYRFDGDDHRTRVIVTVEGEPRGRLRLLGPLLGIAVQRQLHTDHGKLKAILERRRRPPKASAPPPPPPADLDAPREAASGE